MNYVEGDKSQLGSDKVLQYETKGNESKEHTNVISNPLNSNSNSKQNENSKNSNNNNDDIDVNNCNYKKQEEK